MGAVNSILEKDLRARLGDEVLSISKDLRRSRGPRGRGALRLDAVSNNVSFLFPFVVNFGLEWIHGRKQ